MAQLFDTLDAPTFEGLNAEEAFASCVAWEDWAYEEGDEFSDDKWGEVVRIMCANYNRYYAKYEEQDYDAQTL